MRKTISKSTAVQGVILFLAMLAIITIWPLRLYTTTLTTTGGGTIVSESKDINVEHHRVIQDFVAQYDRISSVDVYVTRMEKGRYISCTLSDEKGDQIFRTFVDTYGQEIPGYINIPMEVNLEVGKVYKLGLHDCRSKYYIALEDIPEQPGYLGTFVWVYEPVDGYHMAAKYNYRLPISKKISLVYMGIIAAVAAVLCLLTGLYFKKKPEKNGIVTVQSAVKTALNPLAALFFGALMVMVFPLKVFDFRAADIIFYEIGLLVAAAIVFYAINHKPVRHQEGISFWQSLANKDRAQYLAIMFSMAMAIWYACNYMNDLYDIYHSVSERKMTMWLLIMMIFMFTLKEFFNLYNLVWVVGAGLYGLRYYNLNKMADTEFEYDLHNIILKTGIIIVILSGMLVLNYVRLIVEFIRDRRMGQAHGEKKELAKPTFFGVLMLVMFVLMIIFRNNRLWDIYLVVVYTAFFIRLNAWYKKKDFFKILSGGLMMNFAISLMFSWLHRYFPGYVSGRFAFIFHTVTVTAEYLTFMGAAAGVLLITKIVALPRTTNLRGVFKSAWKEMVLFGFIMSYTIFTVSRTGYLAIIACLLMIILVVIRFHKKQFFRICAVFLLSVIICFPAAFTLQRILPTMVADPVFYDIDDADTLVRGGADWDNTNFMCVERFVKLFGEKILSRDMFTYSYPNDINNYNDAGEPIYDLYGNLIGGEEAENLEKMYEEVAELEKEEAAMAAEASGEEESGEAEEVVEVSAGDANGYVDTSSRMDVLANGRITIFKSYFEQMNMTGHDTMGVMLPNGEIAIHAHNTYIQMAHDHGIPTAIVFIVYLITAIVCGIRYYKKNREEEPLSLLTCAVVIGFAVAGISEWVFHYSNPMTIALMMAVAPITFRTKEK